MSCQLSINQIAGHVGGGERALRLVISVNWRRQTPASLINLQGRVLVGNGMICPAFTVETLQLIDGAAGDLIRDRPLSFTLLAPISAQSIHWIEENRGTNDVNLLIEMPHVWQDLSEEAGKLRAGRVYWEVMRQGHRVSRSDWLCILRDLKWNDYEIFEMSKLPLLGSPELAEAIAILQKAQDALRDQDPTIVMSYCYAALESAAKTQNSDVKRGFATLLQKAMPGNDSKQGALDELIQRLKNYTQFGRHQAIPPIHISREEAEFVLAATASLFSMLTRRLAKVQTSEATTA